MRSHLIRTGWGALFLLTLSTGCSVGPLDPVQEESVRVAADEDYLFGRHAESLVGYAKLSNRARSAPDRNLARLQAALCLLALARTGEAEAELRRLREETRGEGPLAGRTALGLAEVHVARGEFERALQEYERSLTSGGVPADAVLIRGARAARRSGRWDTARRFLLRIVALHPDSNQLALATRLLEEPFYSIQVGVFRDREHAQLLVRRLSRTHDEVRISPAPSSTGLLLHVRIGRFEERAVAEQTCRRLVAEQRLGPDAFVVP